MRRLGGRSVRSGCAAVLAACLAAVAGCGVPDRSDVVLDGPVDPLDISNSPLGIPPPRPSSARSAGDLVMLYLRAAAAGPATAADNLRPFIAPEAVWQPGSDLTVVRVVEGPRVLPQPGREEVTLTLQPVGILTARGTIAPVNRGPEAVSINVVHNNAPLQPDTERPSLLISTPPRGMMVNADAFGQEPTLAMYDAVAVYYWDTSGRVLIPDGRYLSRTLPAARRPTELVKLLITPPSDWLGPGVRALPTGVALRSNVVTEGGRMVVDLSAEAATVDNLDDLAAQLAWTLQAEHRGDIELRIEGQPKLTFRTDAYIAANPAMALSKDPESFCIVDGVVRLACAGTRQLGVLSSPVNRGVVAAAVARDKQHAALVRAGPGSRRTLWLGESREDQAQPDYLNTTLSTTAMSRPVWLPLATTAAPQGLVAAGGELYRFVAGSRTPVALSTGEARNVTAVSVAPDGRRIALVADGRAYIAVLVFKGSTVSMAPPRRLPTDLTDVSAVGWSRPDRLVLLGRVQDGNVLREMAVSGIIEQPIPLDVGDLPVTGLAAYPDHPEDGAVRGRILIEAGGLARSLSLTGQPVLIPFQPAPTAGASPSAEPVTAEPVAPFFLD